MAEYIDKAKILAELDDALMSRAALHDCDLRVIKIIRIFKLMINDFPAADVQPAPKWISVKEKLPPEDESVLIYTIMGMCVAARWDDRFFVSKTASFVKYDVTHWMPLPEPPKDGDAE